MTNKTRRLTFLFCKPCGFVVLLMASYSISCRTRNIEQTEPAFEISSKNVVRITGECLHNPGQATFQTEIQDLTEHRDLLVSLLRSRTRFRSYVDPTMLVAKIGLCNRSGLIQNVYVYAYGTSALVYSFDQKTFFTRQGPYMPIGHDSYLDESSEISALIADVSKSDVNAVATSLSVLKRSSGYVNAD